LAGADQWCSSRCLYRLEDRAPPARRIASNARSYVCFGPVTPVPVGATALFVRRDIETCAKAVARVCPRNNWPETNVGASVARDAPRGRRSISQALNLPCQALAHSAKNQLRRHREHHHRHHQVEHPPGRWPRQPRCQPGRTDRQGREPQQRSTGRPRHIGPGHCLLGTE